ncbi:hypothetical protein BJX68DRAFT_239394 [Aspergillus pseudodeflectus]|uniref:Uncharacterized protein n=1 Tax=Aspergillus pseudodeflectus TaxID=176178 RepID=A0ABR4K5L2_9EURO
MKLSSVDGASMSMNMALVSIKGIMSAPLQALAITVCFRTRSLIQSLCGRGRS